MTRQRKRSAKKAATATQKGITRLQIGIVVGIAVLMVAAFVVLNLGLGSSQATTETGAAGPASTGGESAAAANAGLENIPQGLTEDGNPYLGSPDAPVTIVEYSDYQCPHCGSFAKNTFPAVLQNYIASGKVRYIHKNAAILGEESQWAAMAALCAADQGKFFEYHELLFQKQQSPNQGAFSRDNLKKYAEELGLDTQAFNQCLDQNKYAEKVVRETIQATREEGVEGTPTFFVNGEKIPGNVPFEQMQQIIERQLERTS